jgi:Leucine-rich repeat (LRR) protein
MANPATHTYVDPSIAGNSGTGTSGDPYGDLQYALDTMTRDGTNGDQINIKAGTDEVLSSTLSLTTYTSVSNPSQNAPLTFRGYTTTADDGGQGSIDCGGNALITNVGNSIHWVDLELHNGPQTGTGIFITLSFYAKLINCYVHDTHGTISSTDDATIVGNRIEDMGNVSNGLIICAAGTIAYNYIDVVTGTRDPVQCIRMAGNSNVIGNIIYLDSDADGIRNHSIGRTQSIIGNTVLANGGSGNGIMIDQSGRSDNMVCVNNYVEGFSATGGVGFLSGQSSENGGTVSHNAAFDNATDYSLASEHATIISANETLSVTGLAKSGAITHANRFAYFAPADEGNMRTGGLMAGNT